MNVEKHTRTFAEVVTMEHSPYSPGSLPEYLAGRGRERELIRDR